MKRNDITNILVYGAAVLALSAGPVLAQTGTIPGPGGATSGQSGTTPGQTGSQTPRSGDATMSASSADQAFVMEAAQGGMAEVALGQMASEKASNDRVKQFGQQMVTDHTKANSELKALGQTKMVTVPADLDARHKATQERLSKLSGAAFDRAYMQEMVTDHQKTVADFRTESQSGKDAEVKAWAAKMLPALEQHYRMAQEISQNLGSSPVGTSGTGGTPATGSGGPRPSGTGTGSTGAGSDTPATPHSPNTPH